MHEHAVRTVDAVVADATIAEYLLIADFDCLLMMSMTMMMVNLSILTWQPLVDEVVDATAKYF